jgi:hypothetical protein
MERRTVRHKGLEHVIEVEEARSQQGHRLAGWYLCRVVAPEGQRALIPRNYGHPAFLWEAGSAEAALNQIEDEIHADALEVFDATRLFRPASGPSPMP